MQTRTPDLTAETPQSRFRALFERHQKIVFKVANTYCRHVEDRRDLAQEISVQLWRAFPRYDEGRSFSTWMYRIALNVAISFARRANRHEVQSLFADENLPDASEVTADAQERDEQESILHGFLDRLDDHSRGALATLTGGAQLPRDRRRAGDQRNIVAAKINRLKQRIRQEFNQPKPH
jgi:RNA polymerase sigma factor (sigma-70 family)